MLPMNGGLTLSPSAIVWLLGLSQIIGYGTLYYSFSILAADIGLSFSWPLPWLYGSFSLALFVGGTLAPLIGRRIDRHGAAVLMTIGSALSGAALVFAAAAPNPIAFSIALIALQAASAFVLYDAAFAALVQATGAGARLRITQLTLIAGFASTIFWPLTSWLHTFMGWREIFFAFAGLNLFVCIPVHAILAAARRKASYSPPIVPAPVDVPETRFVAASMPATLHRQTLMLVTAGFALSGFATSAILAQMVPTLDALGLGTSALVVSTIFGPAQVLVRFVNMILGVQRHPMAATLVGLSMPPLAFLVLTATAPMVGGAIVFAILLEFGSGLKSIVQGTLPLALFGPGSYGARLGLMASARQILSAIAPFVLAALVGMIGAAYALAIVAAIGALGFIALWRVARLHAAVRVAQPIEA